MKLHSWNITVRSRRDGYKDEDMVTSGGSYPRYEKHYVVAASAKMAIRQAKLIAGYSQDESLTKSRVNRVVKLATILEIPG